MWLCYGRQNAGFERIIDHGLLNIGGPSQNTIWLFYSRKSIAKEGSFLQKSVELIKLSKPNYPVFLTPQGVAELLAPPKAQIPEQINQTLESFNPVKLTE